MRKQFTSWIAEGQNISVVTYDLVCGALAALMALSAVLRFFTGHRLAALCYFAFAIALLCLFLFANAMIRKDTLQKLFQKGFPALVAVAVFGLTLLYFTDGGMQGGSFLLMMLFISLMPLLFRVGRYLWYMGILLFVCLCNIATSLLYPESVRGEGYSTVDFLIPFVITLMVLAPVIQLYTWAYHRQKATLTEAL
ncbi:MAG: hypothetical protein IJP92_14280, partial [Lachnospiraceae bacterium]|nr:hypothetical protein [Lachnospiraceae bacterium]